MCRVSAHSEMFKKQVNDTYQPLKRDFMHACDVGYQIKAALKLWLLKVFAMPTKALTALDQAKPTRLFLLLLTIMV